LLYAILDTALDRSGDRVKIRSLNNGGMSLSLRPVLIPDPLLDLKVASNSGDTT